MGNHFSEAELIQLATVERRSYTDLTPAHLASDLLDCRAEVVALRERAAAERERRESAENNMASWEETATRFVERVALLEGLLYTPDYAETYGLSPYVAEGARCVRCQSPRGQGHQDFCPVGKYEAALADGG